MEAERVEGVHGWLDWQTDFIQVGGELLACQAVEHQSQDAAGADTAIPDKMLDAMRHGRGFALSLPQPAHGHAARADDK